MIISAVVVAAAAGLAFFGSVAADNPTFKELGPVASRVLFAGLGGFGLLAMAGVFWRDKVDTGPVLEMSGLFGQGGWALGYAAAVLGVNGPRGVFFVVILGALAVANIWRAVQVIQDRRELKALRRVVDAENRSQGE